MGKELLYELEDGTNVPVFEADHDMAFKVYRSDRKRSVIGDPKHCIEANGLCRLKNVKEAYIGSGKDAFIIFEFTPRRAFLHAVHFIIPSSSGRVRDAFDARRDLKSQILMLKVPSKGQSVAYRRKLVKARYEAVKNGAPVKSRGPQSSTRMKRIGMEHRPRAKVRSGIVSIGAGS